MVANFGENHIEIKSFCDRKHHFGSKPFHGIVGENHIEIKPSCENNILGKPFCEENLLHVFSWCSNLVLWVFFFQVVSFCQSVFKRPFVFGPGSFQKYWPFYVHLVVGPIVSGLLWRNCFELFWEIRHQTNVMKPPTDHLKQNKNN